MLYEDIAIEIVKEKCRELSNEDLKSIVENRCYKALEDIRAVLNDDSLNDRECFARIEKIVEIFEKMGSDGGIRHDF